MQLTMADIKHSALKQFTFTLALISLVSTVCCQSSQSSVKTISTTSVRLSSLTAIAQSNQSAESNSQTLTNGEWTIKINNLNSWSGVNGTGNLSYQGCDSRKRCLNLTGGTMTCRDGLCTMAWRNSEHTYIVQQPMDNPDRPTKPGTGTILIVRQGNKIILRATGFKGIAQHKI